MEIIKTIHQFLKVNQIKKNKISINSPIAIGLIGKKIGDIISIKLPNKKIINLKLIKIKI